MSSKKLWFGIPEKHMQWVPAPLAGANSNNNQFTETIQFENGGADARRSKGFHKSYEFEFNEPLEGSENLNVFNKFASGFYGDGLCVFADPYIFESNMFSAPWGTPWLVDSGWPNLYDGPPTIDLISDGTYTPKFGAFWDITSDPNTPTAGGNHTFTVPVPPGYTLHAGASGISTGTAAVQAIPLANDGTPGLAVNLTLLDPDAAVRFNATFDGSASVASVTFYLTRTTTAASTITLNSLMAQLYKTGTAPTLPTQHIPGEGHSGLEFVGDARPETYVYINPPRKALSTTLLEVGAWRGFNSSAIGGGLFPSDFLLPA